MVDVSLFTIPINMLLPEPHASLLNGILYGIPLSSNTVFYSEIKTVGLLHIVVLSGTNITLLSSLIGSILASTGKRVSILLNILIIILFILLVGIKAPILRSGFMAVFTLVSIYYGKRALPLYSLLLSALCISVIWPQWLTSISFQLSYAATLGIILFYKNSTSTDKLTGIGEEFKMYIKNDVRLSISAQIFASPLILLYFNQVSLVSPLANLLISWAIAPLMVFGFITSLLGMIHPSLAFLPASICYGILSYFIFIIHILSQAPYASIYF